LELEILPRVHEDLQKLHDANYLFAVVTNQPDVARGTSKMEDIKLMNAFLLSQLPIDDFKTCYHDSGDKCNCSKAFPGALLEAAQEHNIDLSKSFMVTGRWRDVSAATTGCKIFFINYRKAVQKPDAPDFIVSSLLEAKNNHWRILNEKSRRVKSKDFC